MIDYSKIKAKLQAISCPIHNQPPLINFNGDKASIDTCCDDYAETVLKKMEKLIAKETDKALQKSIDKRFR